VPIASSIMVFVGIRKTVSKGADGAVAVVVNGAAVVVVVVVVVVVDVVTMSSCFDSGYKM
jgi:hypothetical protein